MFYLRSRCTIHHTLTFPSISYFTGPIWTNLFFTILSTIRLLESGLLSSLPFSSPVHEIPSFYPRSTILALRMSTLQTSSLRTADDDRVSTTGPLLSVLSHSSSHRSSTASLPPRPLHHGFSHQSSTTPPPIGPLLQLPRPRLFQPRLFHRWFSTADPLRSILHGQSYTANPLRSILYGHFPAVDLPWPQLYDHYASVSPSRQTSILRAITRRNPTLSSLSPQGFSLPVSPDRLSCP